MSDDKSEIGSIFILMLFLLVICPLIIFITSDVQVGKLANAEQKFQVGQSYECVTSPVEVEGKGWCAVVKRDDQFYGVWFKEQSPLKGLVAKQDEKIIFLPFDEHGKPAVKNTLAEKSDK